MFEPMLAEKAPEPFDSERHIFEVKFDGVRCLVHAKGQQVRLWGRRGTEYTDVFPELCDVHRQVNAEEAWLDAEAVVLDQDGRIDFRAIQSRVHRSKPTAIRIAAQQWPVTLQVFDVLQINDVDLTARGRKVPLDPRKQLLDQLVEPGERVRVVEYREGEGIALFEECMQQDIEGVMAKDRQGLYHPGARHKAWQKLKGLKEDSFIVCGYTAGEGWREGMFGALLLGKPDGAGGLRYCGSVGTGFKVADLDEVQGMLTPLHTTQSPFAETPYEPNLLSYLDPRVVVDVKFHAETPDRKLRFPVYVRVRQDMSPEDVT